jgi:hypothetical protein
MKYCCLILSFILFGLCGSGQTPGSIDAVLSNLSCQSEKIVNDSGVRHLIARGSNLLPALSSRFTDTSLSNVFSKCTNRRLYKGELAVIIADRIKGMPYCLLTGVQNCTLDYCPNNPNLVEYYLDFIKFRGMMSVFRERYDKWLAKEKDENRGN